MLSNIHMHDGFLHSHMSENDIKKDILLLSTEFIDGFTQSNDKMAYLKLSDFLLNLTRAFQKTIRI